MAKPDGQKVELDPADGMLRSIVGSWSLDKHRLLRRYVDISRAARKRWVGTHPSLIDLYCGLGRSRIDAIDQIIDGGVIAAAKEAQKGMPFHQLVIADVEIEDVDDYLASAERHARIAADAGYLAQHPNTLT